MPKNRILVLQTRPAVRKLRQYEHAMDQRITMSEAAAAIKTRVTATLAVQDWARAVEFYKTAFGATELHRVPGGGVVQLSVRGAEFWVAEESKEHLNFSPKSLGGCSVRMLLIVEDPAAVCKQAVAAGATQVYPVADAHGWRIGRIVDPSGHHWEVARELTCR
jgi:PhnB protein